MNSTIALALTLAVSVNCAWVAYLTNTHPGFWLWLFASLLLAKR